MVSYSVIRPSLGNICDLKALTAARRQEGTGKKSTWITADIWYLIWCEFYQNTATSAICGSNFLLEK